MVLGAASEISMTCKGGGKIRKSRSEEGGSVFSFKTRASSRVSFRTIRAAVSLEITKSLHAVAS